MPNRFATVGISCDGASQTLGGALRLRQNALALSLRDKLEAAHQSSMLADAFYAGACDYPVLRESAIRIKRFINRVRPESIGLMQLLHNPIGLFLLGPRA